MNRKNRNVTHHLINRLHDLQHLLVTDLPVAIDIIQLERPFKFIFHLPATCYAQGAYEFLELDDSIVVFVEDAEDVVCERGGIAVREERAVDGLEFFFWEQSGGTVFDEACKFSQYLCIDLVLCMLVSRVFSWGGTPRPPGFGARWPQEDELTGFAEK